MALKIFVDFQKYVGRLLVDGSIGLIEQSAAPGTPLANQLTIYPRDKGGITTLFWKDDTGVEHDLSELLNSSVLGLLGRGGEQGDEGEQGLPGFVGAAGATGLTGTMGLQGEQGDEGEQGYVGSIGATGATGTAGGAANDAFAFFMGGP